MHSNNTEIMKPFIRAILFIVRLQKCVSQRPRRTKNTAVLIKRCQSMRNAKQFKSKYDDRGHRHSAPTLAFLTHLRQRDSDIPCDQTRTTGTFSSMTQPYTLLAEQHGTARVTFTLQKSDAHRMASTTILHRQLHRQHSLTSDGMQAVQRKFIRRCGSENVNDRNKKDCAILQRKLKTNMLNSCGALLAVETDDEETLKMIISKTEVPFDARIDDAYLENWTLLELALMLDHRQCAEILLQNGGAVDVEICPLKRRLQQIRERSELVAQEIRSLRNTTNQNKDSWKQLQYLDKRLMQLKKMKAVVEHTIVPGPLTDVEAVVSASDQLTVRWKDSRQTNMDPVVNYKVEWSLCDDFNTIEGSLLVGNVVKNYAVISGLKRGLRYSVRVSAASIRGYGHPVPAVPQPLLISNLPDSLKRNYCLDDVSKLQQDVEKYRSSPVWQTLFPRVSETVDKKKKGSIKNLFTGGSRSLKVVQRGIYLVSIIYSEMKVCTVEECLPVIPIDQAQFCIGKDEMYWAMKLSLSWDAIHSIQETSSSSSANSHFRTRFIDAATEMHTMLGVKDIGRVHYQPIVDQVNSVSFIVTVRFVTGSQVVQGLTTRWVPLSKVIRKRGTCPAMDLLRKEILRIINFFESSYIPLQKGLYICYMKLHSSVNSISVAVPQNIPSVLPYAFIRENPHITKEEWDWLRSVDINASNPPTPMQFVFHTALVSAASRLLHDLDIDTDLIPNQRLYRLQVFQLQFDVSFIILLPKIEDVCTAPSYSPAKSLPVQQGCLTLPLQVFETIHLCTYNPDFISTYCRLSIFIEHFSTFLQYEQRNSLLEKDVRVYADILGKLNEFQQRLENVWKSMRWIGNVASTARDKQAKCAVPLGRLFAVSTGLDDNGYHSDQGTRRSGSTSSGSTLHLDFYDVRSRSASSVADSPMEPWLDDCFQSKKPQPTTGVIKVYAACQCGLTSGTSVRLQVASRTTASEVVALVIEQLAKAATASGKVMESTDPEDFCLAAVVGSRERRLRDDFPPMKLQNPWAEGRLFVRRRDSVLAALQRGNEAAV